MTLAEFAQTLRQVAIALNALVEHLDMARAVHRLDRVNTTIDSLCRKHVVAKGCVVAGLLPQSLRHDFRGVDLLVTGFGILFSHVGNQSLINSPAVRMPKYGAR